MKLFRVHGLIRCGHRTFNLEKYIVADSRSEARDAYKVEHPHAKVTSVEYKYDLKCADSPHVIAQNFVKNP